MLTEVIPADIKNLFYQMTLKVGRLKGLTLQFYEKLALKRIETLV